MILVTDILELARATGFKGELKSADVKAISKKIMNGFIDDILDKENTDEQTKQA